MDIYLPIANLSVNALVIILLGGGVGVLSGMFGVGGGFLTTPLLIFYGIPPAVAAASASTQVTGASVSGVFAHMKRGGVDFQMGGVLVVGGIFGTGAGAAIFEILESVGQIDTVINILYVLMLGSIGAHALALLSFRSLHFTACAVDIGFRHWHYDHAAWCWRRFHNGARHAVSFGHGRAGGCRDVIIPDFVCDHGVYDDA